MGGIKMRDPERGHRILSGKRDRPEKRLVRVSLNINFISTFSFSENKVQGKEENIQFNIHITTKNLYKNNNCIIKVVFA